MNKVDFFELGYILRPHGTQGDMVVVLDTENPEAYFKIKHIFIEQKQTYLPFGVTALKKQQSQLILSLEDVKTEQRARELKGSALFLPLKDLPKPKDDEYYLHDLVGLLVVDATHGELGLVESVYEAPQYNLLAINHKGHELLVPLTKVFVPELDFERKQIKTSLPEGFLEVYLTEDEEEED